MRLFYKHNDDVYELIQDLDLGSETHKFETLDVVHNYVDAGDGILFESDTEARASVKYAERRKRDYPSMQDQLDQIYHDGIDAWKETIQAVKDAHPKPE